MTSDFYPVRVILADERKRGRSFAEAWELALEALPAIEGTSVEARERRQARDALVSTRAQWRDGYERRPSPFARIAA